MGVVLSETGKLFAIDLATSKILWSKMASRDCVIDRHGRGRGFDPRYVRFLFRVKNGPKIWLRISHSNGKYDLIEPTTGSRSASSACVPVSLSLDSPMLLDDRNDGVWSD